MDCANETLQVSDCATIFAVWESVMNKRNFTRVGYSEGASIRYDEQVVFGHIQDLSLCGMYIDTESEIPINKPVQVTVYHTPTASFKFKARVVRQGAFGYGFQVSQIDVKSFDSLRNIVEMKCSDQTVVMGETYRMLNCITNAGLPV